jgi:hypothetical protein
MAENLLFLGPKKGDDDDDDEAKSNPNFGQNFL